MSRPSSVLFDSLTKRYRSFESTRIKVEKFVNQRRMGQRDSERMYEGLFLSVYAAFEGFLEELFIGLLINGKGVNSSLPDIVPRVSIRSHSIARDLLMGVRSKKYVDWLPYEHTIELSEIYFRGGRPFKGLSNSQNQHLIKCNMIRNAIAHKSRYSMKKFDEQVIANNPIPLKERTPAGYLRGLFRTSPPQTRYENFVVQLLQIARILAR